MSLRYAGKPFRYAAVAFRYATERFRYANVLARACGSVGERVLSYLLER
jgi:hypothetical protein